MLRFLIENPTRIDKNTVEEVLRQNVFLYSYLSTLFAAWLWQKMLKFKGCRHVYHPEK